MAKSDEIIIHSTYADITIDRYTGEIKKINYKEMGGKDEWNDTERFDPLTFDSSDEIDCLDVGYWNKNGHYEPALEEGWRST